MSGRRSTPLGDQSMSTGGGRSFIWFLARLRWISKVPIFVTAPDQDGNFLAVPHVPLLEKHVGCQMTARFHD